MEQENNQQIIPNHLVLAILTTIFCCLPFGIVSIIYASQVNSAVAAGNTQLAMQSSDKAKKWGLAALICGIIFAVVYSVFVILAGAMSAASNGAM